VVNPKAVARIAEPRVLFLFVVQMAVYIRHDLIQFMQRICAVKRLAFLVDEMQSGVDVTSDDGAV
jgi:hypothetical protein